MLFHLQATQIMEQLAAGLASRGVHFYLIRPLRITADVGELAMQYLLRGTHIEDPIYMLVRNGDD